MQAKIDVAKAKQVSENLYSIYNSLKRYQYQLKQLSAEMSVTEDEGQQALVRKLNQIISEYEGKLHRLQIMIRVLEKCASVYQKTEKEVEDSLDGADQLEDSTIGWSSSGIRNLKPWGSTRRYRLFQPGVILIRRLDPRRRFVIPTITVTPDALKKLRQLVY